MSLLQFSILLVVCVAGIAFISYVWYGANAPRAAMEAMNESGPTNVLVAGEIPSEIIGFKFDTDSCTISPAEIFSGGPVKDAIPSLIDPDIVSLDKAGYLDEASRIIGVQINGEARAYPLAILTWHEVINDSVGGMPVLVTYCPLCDSALVFDRMIAGEERIFGVSGYLYNSNVLLYDRHRDDWSRESLWSQMKMKAVCGPAADQGLELELLASELTSWARWKELYPDTTAISDETGHRRNYQEDPYEAYFAGDALMFPADFQEERLVGLPQKTRVVAVKIGDQVKAYPVARLQKAAGDGTTVTDSIAGNDITLHVNQDGSVTVKKATGEPLPVAYTFLFAYLAMHPDGTVFESAEINQTG